MGEGAHNCAKRVLDQRRGWRIANQETREGVNRALSFPSLVQTTLYQGNKNTHSSERPYTLADDDDDDDDIDDADVGGNIRKDKSKTDTNILVCPKKAQTLKIEPSWGAFF